MDHPIIPSPAAGARKAEHYKSRTLPEHYQRSRALNLISSYNTSTLDWAPLTNRRIDCEPLGTWGNQGCNTTATDNRSSIWLP
mmetsp:Transcript_27800/g.33738  ORF Transcript_27800/g.33738 Transcript_27800/m.33738 type:complete len:83 (+) Transcript_27800:2-250(+)